MGRQRSTDDADGAGDPPAAKRPRASAPRNAYPRRRAVTACQLCRMRKSKCDNQRPSCGTCTSLQFQCVYQDTSTDFSSFDPASLAILDRVNYAIRLIEQNPSSSRTSFPDTPGARNAPQEPAESAGSDLTLTTSPSETIYKSTEYTFLLEAQQLQAKCASGRVLKWPSLGGLCDPNEVDKLFFKPARPEEAVEQGVSSRGRGIREEDVSLLIENFLENVHTKNPILDPHELRKLSLRIEEDGFRWDGPSCLILITCALGTVSRPFRLDTVGPRGRSRLDGRDYVTAESYYNAARKRIGLLDPSIIAIQCAFLVGVYEMYTMRPLRASLSFNRACTYFQTHLQSSSFNQPIEQSSETVRSRLYWSCLKSDCEMREEIALPPTELAKVEYSDAFPSPPDSVLYPDGGTQAGLTTTLATSSERSWYYYLSEVAGRRISNRITATLYHLNPEEWTKRPIHHLQRITEELDAQTVQWLENFPPMFQFDGVDTTDELSYFLHARYLDLRERIWRPFLYLAAHSSSQDPNMPIYAQNANLCLENIFKHIRNCFIRHRHHGSWFAGRNLFTKGLLVLVAARSQNIVMPPDWTAMMDNCIAGITYWEDEAPDLRAARLTLQHIYQSVNPPVPAFGSPIQ
ncbi:uncharacterized protein APUU_12134A [Aspergillus puulaauensis]|uniref:Zn(2)-C6 fungal-type domain-containing protein n=1 Tax=Aspergillus puulaauensis TaxID=1220207 RepID=A0A7R7XD96_9EURO|nr:uncharacterized protein APUU_12134A [Aspergillus puulaauensis]BCS19306.1 hypothetical protein APUU_12134A [Aspergillus puulaauensis]